jgi:hypothetical protein
VGLDFPSITDVLTLAMIGVGSDFWSRFAVAFV